MQIEWPWWISTRHLYYSDHKQKRPDMTKVMALFIVRTYTLTQA